MKHRIIPQRQTNLSGPKDIINITSNIENAGETIDYGPSLDDEE
ncbi:MAG: hypothetical protein K0R31_535 [Clostridiales bacterium]|jgi:hypothetical protein|nr:hypothetical protein [Clostridiales bacterium]